MAEKSKKIFNARPLFYGFLALLLAISTSRYVFAGDVKYIIFDCVIFLAFAVFCIWAKNFKTLIAIICVLAFGFGWFFVGQANFLGKVYEGTCQVVGRISDNVNFSSYGNSADVVLKDVYINGQKEKNIALKIYIDSTDDFEIGDIIAFEAEVDRVSLFTLGDFNSFYFRDDTPYTSSVSADDFFVQGNSLNFDERFRLQVKDLLYQNMDEDSGAVAFALLFGDRIEVDDDIYDAYKTSGIVHVLTVSGLHVSFLFGLLGFFMKKLKVRGIYNFLICAVCLIFYTWLCGFVSTMVRSGIMGLVLLGAKLSGKCYDNLNSLGLAGILILLFSPLSALDLSFLMSFFCMIGIFVISPYLSKLFRKALPKAVADSIAVSISAEIGILPFVASIYAGVNFLSFFVNLIVIPIFSIIYPILFVGMFLVMLMPFLGFVFTVCGWGLNFVAQIASFFADATFVLNAEPLDIFLVALMFVLFFLCSRFFMTSKKTKTVCCCCILVLGGVLGCVNLIPQDVSACVSYGYNYSAPIVMLTNDSGKSVIVDIGYYSYTKNMMRASKIDSCDTIFVLQRSNVSVDTAREIGVENIIRCDAGQGLDEDVVVNFDQIGLVDGFSFVYRSYNDRLIGLEISFDDINVFILRDLNQTDEALDFVANENYDIVILGKHDEYADHFSGSQILTFYENPLAETSFANNGNIYCNLGDKKFDWRCLD